MAGRASPSSAPRTATARGWQRSCSGCVELDDARAVRRLRPLHPRDLEPDGRARDRPGGGGPAGRAVPQSAAVHPRAARLHAGRRHPHALRGDRAGSWPASRRRPADGRIGKLVPASGAASRMFKALLADLNAGAEEPAAGGPHLLRQPPALRLLRGPRRVARRARPDAAERRRTVLEYLLTEKGLELRRAAQGAAPLPPLPRRAAHAVRGAPGRGGRTRPATPTASAGSTSPSRRSTRRGSATLLEEVRPRSRSATAAASRSPSPTSSARPTRWPSTWRTARSGRTDGTLLFRPGGHGALLDNLDDSPRRAGTSSCSRTSTTWCPTAASPW